jgi:menaquinone-specific isochorismate synthase
VDLNFSEPSFEPFRSVFLDLQAKFKRGELKKAVPFVVSEAPGLLGAGDRLLLLIELLRNTAGVPVHLYGVWDEAQGVLGGTPEILFSKGLDSTLSAVALAGTRIHDLASDGKSSALALLDDPKEREEHQLVIDGILSSLQASFPSSLRDFKTGKCFELVLPTLSHLCTPLYFCVQTSADSEEPQGGPYFEFERLVRALHPTPALGAFPKEAGREWLAALQKGVDRKRFGAPFGAIVPGGQWHCWVGIRNIQWDVNSVQIYAGCGVITASVLEREWLELLGKVQAIKRMLGL